MGFWEETVVKAKEIIDVAGKKTTEIVELQKLKYQAAALQSQLSKEYETLGRLQYETAVSGADNAQAMDLVVRSVTEKLGKLSALELEISRYKGQKVCACGAVNDSEAAYCKKCGEPLDDKAPKQESAEQSKE